MSVQTFFLCRQNDEATPAFQSTPSADNPSGPVYATPNIKKKSDSMSATNSQANGNTHEAEQKDKLGDIECQIPANSTCIYEYETQFGLRKMGHVDIYMLDTFKGFNEVGSADEIQP